MPPTLTKQYLAQIGGWAVLKEAGALVQAGRVAAVAFDGNELSGQLRLATGTLTSRLRLGVRLADVENFCPCRQAREHGTICPHAIALGLAWIEKGNHAAAPAPAAAPIAPASPAPAAASRVVAAGEAGVEAAQALAVSFLFPLQFAEAWKTGKLRVILEAASDGAAPLPWDTAIQGRTGPLAVQDEAADALRLLERREGGKLTGIVQLAAADFDAFFLGLVDAPRLGLGKKSALEIRRSPVKPRVRVVTQADGRMRVEWIGTPLQGGEWLPSRQGRWRFTGDALEFHPLANPLLQRLASQPLVLGAGEIPHFLQLPSLAEQVEIELCPLSEKIEWREARPRFRAELDGTLQGLVVRLEARYGENAVLLSGPAFAAPKADDPGRWLPDAANPRLYLGRDGKTETQARAELAVAGFAPLPRQADRQGLNGEPAVISFLANHLPEWRRHWEIELSPRFQALLGQCEVVEPRVAIRASGDEWLTLDTEFRGASGKSDVSLSPGEVQQLLQTGRSHKKLSNGRIALLPSRAVAAWQEVLTDCDPEAGLTGARIGRNHAPYLEEALRESGIVQTGGQPWTAPKRLREIVPLPLPAALEPILRPYQKEGVAWLHGLAENGFAGILADEMGLGKTIQVLAWLAARHEAGRKELALVVAPTSLLVNWQREAERFAPGLRVAVLHGSERHGTWENLAGYDLLVTSYALLRRDIEKYQGTEFGVAVLDEAQHIKNRFSQNAQAVKALRARHRVILTGTPLENSLLDLWSMFDFLMPGYLGPAKAFRERYEVPVLRSDLAALKRLRQRVHPFLLRRTKADVAAEIPARLDNVISCDLTAEQREVYQAVLEQGRRDVFEHSGKQGNPGKRTMAMLTALTRLRQACCHLDLLPLDRPAPWKEPSAKLDALFEIVSEAVDGGHRLLVFSQFVKLLRLVEARLKKEELSYCYLDGSTADRQAEIDRFQNSPSIPVFLISLKAGGSGLNLTGADTVVHCDPWWNPAVEEQATARAHRIGQQKVVTSYKLIARGTVEEKIVQLQEKKRQLAEQALGPDGDRDGAFLSKLTQEEWEDLLAAP